METLKRELESIEVRKVDILKRMEDIRMEDTKYAEAKKKAAEAAQNAANAKIAYDWIKSQNCSAYCAARRNFSIGPMRGPNPPHVVINAKYSTTTLNGVDIVEDYNWLLANPSKVLLVLDAIKSGCTSW